MNLGQEGEIVNFHSASLSVRVGEEIKHLSKILSRLHVDYAAARDDQYEFECKQREAEREKRHITQSIKQLTRPPRSCFINHTHFSKTGLISCEIMCDGWMNIKRQTEQ